MTSNVNTTSNMKMIFNMMMTLNKPNQAYCTNQITLSPLNPTKPTKQNLPYQTKATANQTYKTKQNLPYQTKPTKPILQNQNIQTYPYKMPHSDIITVPKANLAKQNHVKPDKHSSAPACYVINDNVMIIINVSEFLGCPIIKLWIS